MMCNQPLFKLMRGEQGSSDLHIKYHKRCFIILHRWGKKGTIHGLSELALS